MHLGDTIRQLRTERGLSQSQLADQLGVSRQSVSKWETNTAVPDLDKLISIANLFGVSLDTLINDAPDQTNQPAEAAETPPKKHRRAGLLLLILGAGFTLLFSFLFGLFTGLLFSLPFFLCGILCLSPLQKTGLWCGWAVFLCADGYLRLATGITWRYIFLTPYFTPEMNYLRLATGWGQFAVTLLLILLTLGAYRTLTISFGRKPMVALACGWVALVGGILLERGLLSYLSAYSFQTLPSLGTLFFLVNTCGDWLLLGLLMVLLIRTAALIRPALTEEHPK